jgi:hypothetical protein
MLYHPLAVQPSSLEAQLNNFRLFEPTLSRVRIIVSTFHCRLSLPHSLSSQYLEPSIPASIPENPHLKSRPPISPPPSLNIPTILTSAGVIAHAARRAERTMPPYPTHFHPVQEATKYIGNHCGNAALTTVLGRSQGMIMRRKSTIRCIILLLSRLLSRASFIWRWGLWIEGSLEVRYAVSFLLIRTPSTTPSRIKSRNWSVLTHNSGHRIRHPPYPTSHLNLATLLPQRRVRKELRRQSGPPQRILIPGFRGRGQGEDSQLCQLQHCEARV